MIYFTKVDCEVSKWTEWTECDKDCGGGSQIRTRKVISEAKNGGKECGKLKETKDCNTQECPIDCKLSDEWSEWSQCDKECGGGEQKRTRKILVEPKNGGKACQGGEEIRRCNDNICGNALTPPEISLCMDFVVYNRDVPTDKETPTLKNNKTNLKDFCTTEINKIINLKCANDTEDLFCKYINKKIAKVDLEKGCENMSPSDKRSCDYVKMFY